MDVSSFNIHIFELEPSVGMSNHGPKPSFLQQSETSVSSQTASDHACLWGERLDSGAQIGP